MKKTVNVSLSGFAFTIEEDAYQRLESYLEAIKHHFAAYPERDEIVSDIESRIAEKIMEQIGREKTLTITMIEEQIHSMGEVADLGDEEMKSEEHKESKRLFRDGDNKIIAGVCSGLAAYFVVDPVWVRLGFGISIVFGGFGVVLYVILWMIIPEAKTNLEKAQMRGKPFNLSEFEKGVKERLEYLKRENGPNLKRAGEGLAGFLTQVVQRFGQAIGAIVKVFFKIIGAIIAVACSLALAAVVFAAVTFLVNRESPYVDIGLILPASPLMTALVVLSIVLVAAVPIIFLILLGSSLTSGRNAFTKMATFPLLALWVLGIISTANFGLRYGPEIREQIEQDYSAEAETRSFDVAGFSSVKVSGNHHVVVGRGEPFTVVAKGSARNLDALEVNVQGGVLLIGHREPWRVCILCWRRPTQIIVTMPRLEGVKISGASRADISGFDGSDMDMELSGASRGMLSGSFPSVRADIAGASRLTLSGAARVLEAELSGASRLDSVEAVIETANIDLSGASRISLGSVQSLVGSASGASRVTYRGDPIVKEVKLSGSSWMKPDLADDEEDDDFDDSLVSPIPLVPPAPITSVPPRTASGANK